MKSFLKSVARGVSFLAVTPLIVSHLLASRIASADGSIESHSQLLALVPGGVGNYLRVAFYRVAIEYCDASATICFGSLLSKVGARIEKNVYVGPRCMLGLVTLEQDVLLGPAVQIPSGPMTHGIQRLDTPIRTQPGSQRRLTIGRDSWIGAAAIVLSDVEEQSIVGSGAIVVRPIPRCVIAAGNPARVIRARTNPAVE
jgi:acetyltransferase-like isoleucine patch superfamily enzyme